MQANDLNISPATDKYKRNLQSYLPFAFTCFLAIAVFIRHLLVFKRGTSFIVSRVTIDDTFYYLNIAWNQRHLGFTTFDGINPTNGVQFLWHWVLVLFSYLFNTRESFLYGSLVLCAVLSVLSIFAAYRLGQVLGLGWKSIIPAVAVAGLACYNKTLIVGLENTLQLLLILLLMIGYCRFLQNPLDTKYAARRYLKITCLLGLITWARLDNAPVSAILFTYATFEFWRANRTQPGFYLRHILLSSAIIGLSIVIMFYGFYLMGGSFIPVSGLWKERVPGEDNLLAVFVTAWQTGLQPVLPLEHVFSEPLRQMLSLVLSVLFVVMLVTRYRSAAFTNTKPLLRGLFIIFVSIIFHQMLMVYKLPPIVLGRGFWYRGPELVMMIIIISLLIHWFSELRAFDNTRIYQRLGAIATLLFVANTLVFSLYTNNGYLKDTSYDKFHFQRVEVAFWLKAHFPPGVRFGSLNSGELGFYSERPMTNLDGLVNSYEYFKFRKNGGGVREFCDLQGIDYFVDYMIPDDIKKNSELIYTFPTNPAIQLIKLR